MNNLVIRPFEESLAADYFDFHETRTDGSSSPICYCHIWNMKESELVEIEEIYKAQKGIGMRELLRTATEKLISENKLHGYLAYLDGIVVGWCNAGDKDSYEFLGRHVKKSEVVTTCKTKSIVCFEISLNHREQGIAQKMLEYICEDAKKDGYEMIEAYPNIHAIPYLENYGKYLSLYRKNKFQVVYRCNDGSVVQKKL